MEPDGLTRDYLTRLDAAASVLPLARREELVNDVREHIELALAEIDPNDVAAVRLVLERLGSPDEIVTAEADGLESTLAPAAVGTGPAGGDRRPLSVETRALLLMTLGAVVLPFAGPLIGLWYVSASTRWSLTQKRTAALIVLVLLVMPVALVVPALVAGEITWVFTTAGFSLPLVPLSGITAAAYLVASSTLVFSISRRP